MDDSVLNRVRVLVAVLCLGTLLPGCADSASGTPIDESPLAPGAGQSPLQTPPSVPIPSDGTGAVLGRLVASDVSSLVGLVVYLGDIVEFADDMHGGVLDRQNAPFAVLEPGSGWFVLTDVTPGQYSLIVADPEAGGRQYSMPDGDAYVVDVVADRVTDLGEVRLDGS